jgi:hypothetical protein
MSILEVLKMTIQDLIDRKKEAERIFNEADADQYELIDYAIYEMLSVDKQIEMLRRG